MGAKSMAFVVHRTPARIRIKVPERQHQELYFAELRRVLLQRPGIRDAHVNPLTASVIVEYEAAFALATQHHHFSGLEDLFDMPITARSGDIVRTYEGVETSAQSTIGLLALVLKFVIAIATKQLGGHLTEWAVDAFVQAAKHEANRRAVRPASMARLQLLPAGAA
jgi:hypothetical protein